MSDKSESWGKSLKANNGKKGPHGYYNFKNKNKILGITPEDIGKKAIERGIPTILDYFKNRDNWRK